MSRTLYWHAQLGFHEARDRRDAKLHTYSYSPSAKLWHLLMRSPKHGIVSWVRVDASRVPRTVRMEALLLGLQVS